MGGLSLLWQGQPTHCEGYFMPRLTRFCFLVGCILALAACEDISETPTPTITPTVFILPATPTTNPLFPTTVGNDNPPSLATLAFAYTPSAPELVNGSTATPPPFPTEASFPLQFRLGSTQTLGGIYYGAVVQPAPLVLLLQSTAEQFGGWAITAGVMQASGFNAFALQASDANTVALAEVVARLQALPGVDSSRLYMVGIGKMGGLALMACARIAPCRGVGLFDVAASDFAALNIDVAVAMAEYGDRPLFVAARQTDTAAVAMAESLGGIAKGKLQVQAYSEAALALGLFDSQPELRLLLTEWLLKN
jgi:hypothetical protein